MTPLDCSQVDDLLLDFLYDELPAEERQAVEQHLEGCPRCSAEVAGFRRVRQAARALPALEPSPLVTQRLLEAAAGRNVVPLPRPGAKAGGTEAGAAATSAPRVQPAGPGATSLGGTGPGAGPPTGDNSASVAAQVIDAAKARARRWYAHPAWSAAALFAVGLAGTTWMLATRPELVTRPQPAASAPSEVARDPAEAAKAPSPAVTPAGPTTPPRVRLGEEHNEQKVVDRPAANSASASERDDRRQRAMREVAAHGQGTPGDGRSDGARGAAASPVLGGSAGPSLGGKGAGGSEAAGGEVADDVVGRDVPGAPSTAGPKGRTPQASSAPPQPAPQRPPSGHGKSLDPGTYAVLERSIDANTKHGKAAAKDQPADKAPARAEAEAVPAPRPAATSASDEEGRAQGGSRYAPPPPPMPAAAASPAPATAPQHQRQAPARTGQAPPMVAAEAPVASPPPAQAAGQLADTLEEAGKEGAARRAKVDSEERTSTSAAARLEAAYAQGACADGVARYRALRRSQPGHSIPGAQRLWVATCMVKAGDLQQARREAAGLRLNEPEWAASVDELLATIDRQELTLRRAAEPTPTVRSKAAQPTKAKVAPAAPAEQQRQASPTP